MADALKAPFFDIQDSQLTDLKGKVVLITGGSSGIGLGTARVCLNAGAKVVVGDVNECSEKHDDLSYVHLDTSSWDANVKFFKKAIEQHGRIDHVFANAGVGPIDDFVTDRLDSNGELLPPNMKCMDIGCSGFIYTCKLAVHYIRKNPNGGSVVLTASGSSFMPFTANDYGTAKHAVLGLTRNLTACLADTAIRANCIAPLWTATGLVPAQDMKDRMGIVSQTPEAVGRSVALLMTDPSRKGQCIFSRRGEYKEINQGLLQATFALMEPDERDMPSDPETLRLFKGMFDEQMERENRAVST